MSSRWKDFKTKIIYIIIYNIYTYNVCCIYLYILYKTYMYTYIVDVYVEEADSK
jgi:hypothetical protein